ncbi:chorismate-binding protein [Caldinitratiruptor microaerophilus]|uniref:Anthranilate synthase component 1 n=1 Tax=Caldinitratiruptor microaerophilus TaxID=671077 RepID=A0AA35G7L3_9FIRM|nr:chorismate-binding protein [Caldinitratiruptor microaerophilus]BDG60216.1 hypothetical protein caldi_13060 [Caldinitratiruptor microaerophilus]
MGPGDPPARSRPLPAWGPADLAAALAPPVAVLGGLVAAGRRYDLVAWQPVARASTLEGALSLAGRAAPEAAGALPPGAAALLGAVVGTLAWDGSARFWLPGAAALFDRHTGTLWYRGELPAPEPAGAPGASGGVRTGSGPPAAARPLWDRAGFSTAVQEARRRMAAGVLQKVVLSVPLSAPCGLPPAGVFRRLTASDPPGLRFLLADGPGAPVLAGVSPEPLVTLTGRRAELHLLAGTRPEGAGPAAALLASRKDRFEHAVAVEQGRRDLLSVCRPGSVAVESFLVPERHPGLVHLASHIAGELREDAGPADLIRACFPAGTVSGVPRGPAVALIEALEPVPRGWYAGAVGALLPGGDVQLWLTIRTAAIEGGTVRVRAGAGVVPESEPEAEWAECLAKARRTLEALGAEVVDAERA